MLLFCNRKTTAIQVTGKLTPLLQFESRTINSGKVWKKQSITITNEESFKTTMIVLS
jgi:hypothetical protein